MISSTIADYYTRNAIKGSKGVIYLLGINVWCLILVQEVQDQTQLKLGRK